MNPLLPKISFSSVVSEPSEALLHRRPARKPKAAGTITPEAEDQLTYYSTSMCHVVRSALWKMGGDIKEVSDKLSIPLETFQAWKRKFPEFKTACEEGIRLSTLEIETALRGVAVPHDEVSEEKGPDGVVTYTKKAVVDTKAAIAILKAKGDADWKNSKGTGGGITGNTIKVNINHFGGQAQTKPSVVTVEAKPVESPEESDGSDD